MRQVRCERQTKETSISILFDPDGSGNHVIETGIPFFNHMMSSFTRHGKFDMNLTATGDIDVGYHHTIEDIGILLGQAFNESIGDGRGIRRFSHAIIPMDESLATVAVDISGRPYLNYSVLFNSSIEGVLEPYLVEHFFESFAHNARITLYIECKGRSDHHMCEAIFKATGIALGQALEITSPGGDIPSTKGTL